MEGREGGQGEELARRRRKVALPLKLAGVSRELWRYLERKAVSSQSLQLQAMVTVESTESEVLG